MSLRCCEMAIPSVVSAGFGEQVLFHLRAVVAANCSECLTGYEPGGEILRRERMPFVLQRVEAVALLAKTMQPLVNPNHHRPDLRGRLERAVALWPGPDHLGERASASGLSAAALRAPPETVAGPAWRRWLRDAGLRPDLAYACAALVDPDPQVTPATAPLYLTEPEQGSVVWEASFQAAILPGGSGEILPHPIRMLPCSIDAECLEAVADARQRAIAEGLLDPSADVIWWIRSVDGRHVSRLSQDSAGLAAAMAMAMGTAEATTPLPRDWFFAGSVRAFDGARIADPDALGKKYRKVNRRSSGGRLVVPQQDLERFVAVTGQRQRIEGVSSLRAALGLATRPSAHSPLLLSFSDEELPLVPRWGEAQLRATAALAETDGATALVIGDLGTAKRALIATARRGLVRDGWTVAYHRCYSRRRGQRVFAPFRDLLSQLQRALRDTDAEGAGQLSALRADLVESIAGPLEEGRLRLRTGSIGRRLSEQIAATVTALARTRPIALLLDDLHWADETSIALFIDLAERIRVSGGQQLLLAGGLRRMTGEGRLRDRLDATLAELGAPGEPKLRVVALRDLPAAGQEQLVRDAFSAVRCDDPDPGLVRVLAQRARGNVFSLKLAIDWLHDRRTIDGERGRWQLGELAAGDIPSDDELIAHFFRKLSHQTQDALRRAAVIGREFDLELLGGILDEDVGQATLRDWLDDSHLVARVDAADRAKPVYEFLHTRIQSWLADTLPAGNRQTFNRNIAEAHERQQDSADYELVCHLLAWHWQQAGEPQRSAPHWAYLAARDRQLGAYDSALRARGQELRCRTAHEPEDDVQRVDWQLEVARAHLQRATILRLRGWQGDLRSAAEAVAQARQELDDVLGSSAAMAPERVMGSLPGGLGPRWLLRRAQAEVESGEIARIGGRLDPAQTSLETAMGWGELLRTSLGEEHPTVVADARRLLATAGCSLMRLHLTRAVCCLNYEPHDEDARRGQETRIMYLCTRLLALADHLDDPGEEAELRVRALRSQGNVFFRLEGHAALADAYFQRAEAALGTIAPAASTVGARIGQADEDVYDARARLRLACAEVLEARSDLKRFRRWAEEVGANEHKTAADFTEALIETVSATAADERGLTGSLERAAQLLDSASHAPDAAYPELPLRVLLLRRWIAVHQGEADPARWDGRIRDAQPDVWRAIPDEFHRDPRLQLFGELMSEVPWWVAEQLEAQALDGRPLPRSAALLLTAARDREAELTASAGSPGAADAGIDVVDELKARVRAMVSRRRFHRRVLAVAEEVARLCALHCPGDEAALRALACAVWVHDCLGELSDEQLRRLAQEWGVTATPAEHAHPSWLQGSLGLRLVTHELAHLAQEGPEFNDTLADAVAQHVWPGVGWTRWAQLFYVACNLVALRGTVERAEEPVPFGHPSTERERERARAALDDVSRLLERPELLEQAALRVLRWSVQRRRARGESIHPRTLALLQQTDGRS